VRFPSTSNTVPCALYRIPSPLPRLGEGNDALDNDEDGIDDEGNLEVGDILRITRSSRMNSSRSPVTRRTSVVTLLPPIRTSLYTGKNPTAPFGLLPVRSTVNGKCWTIACAISGGEGGADQPFGKNIGLNDGG